MRINEIINEVWSKGNITQNQMIRLVQNTIGNKGTVEKLDRSTGKEAKVTMKYIDFIDVFSGLPGGVDRLLQLMSHRSTHDIDSLSMDRTKAEKFLHKLYNKAYNNIREFMPYGWIVAGMDVGKPHIQTLNNDISFYIKRDLSDKKENVGTYYHATLKEHAESILKTGLQPGRGTRHEYDAYRSRVFLAESLENLDWDFLSILLGKGTPFGGHYENVDIVVFEVELPEDVDVYTDDQYEGGVFIEEHIPPENLKVVYNGKLDDITWSVPFDMDTIYTPQMFS